MNKEILTALKNVGAFLLAFVLPILFFGSGQHGMATVLPFIVCPLLMAGAAWFTAGKEASITKWVIWGAIVGVLYAIVLVAAV